MKLVVREHVNSIVEVTKREFSVNVTAIDSYGKIPESIGQAKGDLIAFRGAGDPVRLPVGTTGKVLTADPTQPLGMRWDEAGGGGGGAKVLLKNASGVMVTQGTIVYVFEPDNYGREAAKAPYWQEGQLYIVAEDTASGADMDCYCSPGSLVQVLVSGACEIGDPLVVSGTAGVAEALPGGIPTVGIAQETKASNTTGLVTAILVENKGTGACNADSLSHIAGTVYALSGGNDTDGMGHILPNVMPVAKGKRPYGIQANSQCNYEAPVLLHTKPGETAVALADTGKIEVGDWLIPSSSPGRICNGNGYGIGSAISSKAAGAVGEVKVRLMPMVYGTTPRAWWLVGGLTESNVICVFQFVGASSEANALISLEGNGISLTSTGSPTWNADSGFYFSAKAKYLYSSTLASEAENILSCAFGYKRSSANSSCGGMSWGTRVLTLGMQTFANSAVSKDNYPSINTSTSFGTSYSYKKISQQNTSGVLGGNWDSNRAIFVDGVNTNLTSASANNAQGGNANSFGFGNWKSVNSNTADPFYMTAIVLYNTVLTSAQHAELAENIHLLGGV